MKTISLLIIITTFKKRNFIKVKENSILFMILSIHIQENSKYNMSKHHITIYENLIAYLFDNYKMPSNDSNHFHSNKRYLK